MLQVLQALKWYESLKKLCSMRVSHRDVRFMISGLAVHIKWVFKYTLPCVASISRYVHDVDAFVDERLLYSPARPHFKQ